MKKKIPENDFETECRLKFRRCCVLYSEAQYHSEKRFYMTKAYEVIDAFLDWRDVQSL